jgi:hypothetical protein
MSDENQIEVETNEAPTQEVESTPTPEATEVENQETEEVENEDGDSDTQEEKPKKGFQKRIDKLTKQRREKELEAEYWRNEALRAQKNQEQKPADQPTQDKEGQPKEEDFDDYMDFVRAEAQWTVKQEFKAVEEKKRTEAQKRNRQEQQKEFAERLNSFRGETPDFDEVIDSVEDAHMSLSVSEAISTSEVPGQLMYELAQNPKELERLNSLSDIAAIRAIGKLEAKFSATETKPKPTTKAPKPLKTVGSGTGVKVVKDLGSEDISFKEYEAARNKQLNG